MGNVPTTNLNAYYATTTPGNTIQSGPIDPALQDLAQTINDNWAEFSNFILALLPTPGELGIPDQTIVSRHIRNSAIITSKLAALGVTTEKLADGSVTLAKLADLVVTAAKIANGTITEPKYADASVSNRALAEQSVTASKLDPSLLNIFTDPALQAQLILRVKWFSSVSAMKSDATLSIGQKVSTLGYYTPGDKGDSQYQIVSSGTGTDNGGSYITLNNGLQAKLIHDGTVHVKQFGAVSNSQVANPANDDIIPLQNAMNFEEALHLRFGSNNYLIGSTLILRDNVVVDFENSIISANFSTGYIIRTKYYASGKKKFTIKGNGNSIGGYGANAASRNLNGLFIDSCNFSNFSNLVFQGMNGHSVVIGPTGVEDIKNITIDNIETNTGEGFRILAGLVEGTEYKNVTTGRIKDCFWTNPGYEGGKALEIIANNKTDGSASSVFGLTFSRNSFNPTHVNGATMIDIRASGISSIYNLRFENCEGEMRYAGSTPLYPSINLVNVNNCYFDVKGQQVKSKGIKLVNSKYNVFEFLEDGNISDTNTGYLFDFDETSNGNLMKDISSTELISTEQGYTTAPMASYFMRRLNDRGFGNKAYGYVSSEINRVIKKDYFSLINSSGNFINPLLAGKESTYIAAYTTSTDILKVTFKAGANSGFQFRFGTAVASGEYVSIRVRYRFLSTSFTGAEFYCTSSSDGTPRNTRLKVSTDWVEHVFMTRKTGLTNVIYANGTLSNDIDIEFKEIDIFRGALPYVPNLNPRDTEDVFHKNPYFTTANRPVSVAIAFEGFDSTLNKEITWNGTVWKDGSGTTV